jgi:hypothetical protein
MIEAAERVRPKPSRTALVLVLAADMAFGTAVGFGVYFATRRFGPPTPPQNVEASAALCLPPECRDITPSVTLEWSPPGAGGDVTSYVVRREGEEIGRLGASTRTFTDPDVEIGQRYGYDVYAIGEEGRGRPSPATDVEVPVPPIEHAHFAGAYTVELVFRRIGLLSRFEGVVNPAVGDRVVQDWDLLSVCAPLQGACDAALFGFELTRKGRQYRGTVNAEARCGDEELRSKQTVTLRVTKASVVGQVLIVTAFTGLSEVDFRCGGRNVHAVAAISGTRA